MQQKRKTPMRMCTGCGEMRPKQELVRVVRSPEGDISVDLTGKKAGRGAYICGQPECLKRAQKSHALERALDAKIDEAVFAQLEAQIASAATPANG